MLINNEIRLNPKNNNNNDLVLNLLSKIFGQNTVAVIFRQKNKGTTQPNNKNRHMKIIIIIIKNDLKNKTKKINKE